MLRRRWSDGIEAIVRESAPEEVSCGREPPSQCQTTSDRAAVTIVSISLYVEPGADAIRCCREVDYGTTKKDWTANEAEV